VGGLKGRKWTGTIEAPNRLRRYRAKANIKLVKIEFPKGQFAYLHPSASSSATNPGVGVAEEGGVVYGDKI
jgi:hypothetical protein